MIVSVWVSWYMAEFAAEARIFLLFSDCVSLFFMKESQGSGNLECSKNHRV